MSSKIGVTTPASVGPTGVPGVFGTARALSGQSTALTSHMSHATSKVDMGSAKICPKCKSIRKRRYEISMPYWTIAEVQKHRSLDERLHGFELPIRPPRVSATFAWWNRGIIRWLICPSVSAPYFFCWEAVTCRKCVEETVNHEYSYYRQFGRIRMVIIWARSLVPGSSGCGFTLVQIFFPPSPKNDQKA